MCGLLGCMGPGISTRDLDIMKELFIVSQLRGTDSTGVFQIKSTKTNYYAHGNYSAWDHETLYKSADNASTYLEDVEDDTRLRHTLLNTTMVDVIMGHVRAATRGAVNNLNAHPFRMTNIVGAHNGTLRDTKYMKIGKTDSELMFADMDERGIIPVLEELDRDSAFAVSIYDYRDRTMYFSRNDLRTLGFAFLEERGVLYWASELSMLEYILKRKGVAYKAFTLRPDTVVSVKASDLNITTIRDNPMKTMTLVAKLNRELPTQIALMRERMAAAKAAEENKAKEEVKEVKDEKKEDTKAKEEKKSNVTPFPKKSKVEAKKLRTKNFMASCECGCFKMNLVQQSRIARGLNDQIRYDEEADKFYCKQEGCDPLNIEVKEKA